MRKHHEIGFESFEDYYQKDKNTNTVTDKVEKHFNFTNASHKNGTNNNTLNLSTAEAHSGITSLKVNKNSAISVDKNLEVCGENGIEAIEDVHYLEYDIKGKPDVFDVFIDVLKNDDYGPEGANKGRLKLISDGSAAYFANQGLGFIKQAVVVDNNTTYNPYDDQIKLTIHKGEYDTYRTQKNASFNDVGIKIRYQIENASEIVSNGTVRFFRTPNFFKNQPLLEYTPEEWGEFAMNDFETDGFYRFDVLVPLHYYPNLTSSLLDVKTRIPDKNKHQIIVPAYLYENFSYGNGKLDFMNFQWSFSNKNYFKVYDFQGNSGEKTEGNQHYTYPNVYGTSSGNCNGNCRNISFGSAHRTPGAFFTIRAKIPVDMTTTETVSYNILFKDSVHGDVPLNNFIALKIKR